MAVCLIVVGAVVKSALRRELSSSVLLAATPASLQLLFLAYPIVTREAFEAFSITFGRLL